MAPMTRAADQDSKSNNQGAEITLYWLNNSRAQRIAFLLETLSLDYKIETFHRKQMLAPDTLKSIHPLGKSPILTITPPSPSSTPTANNADSSSTKLNTNTPSNPIVLAESGVIIEYLLSHYGGSLVPTQWREGMEGKVGGETEAWLRYKYYLHYAEGSLMPLLVLALTMRAMVSGSPFFIRPITATITGMVDSRYLGPSFTTHLSFLESQLASAPGLPTPSESAPDAEPTSRYLTGPKLSGADIIMSYPLMAGRERAGLTKEKYPLLWTYVERLEQEEGWVKAKERLEALEGEGKAGVTM